MVFNSIMQGVYLPGVHPRFPELLLLLLLLLPVVLLVLLFNYQNYARGHDASWHDLYDKLTRLAETRLAQDTLPYMNTA